MAQDTIDALQQDWSGQRPDLDVEAMGVVLRIQALDKILGDQAAQGLQAFGLQWWQYDVLSALRRQGLPYQMAATELAAASRLTSGAMTNRIDRLENSGLVRRLHDSHDRRRVLIRLTREGRRLIDSAIKQRFEIATAALASLDDRSRRQLSDLLRRLLLAQEGQEPG